MGFSSLYIGYSALSAAQRSVEVAAHNVANANTTGFTRQRLEVQTSMPTPGTAGLRGDGMRGTGVTVVSIGRLRDHLADVSWRSEAGVEGAATARSEALSRTEQALGTYAAGSPEALSSFLSAWDGLSLNPSDQAARSTVLSTGRALAAGLRASSAGLDDVQSELTARIGDGLGEVNGLLTQVASLNGAIQRARIAGSDPNDLLDSRDAAVDRVVRLTGATVSDGDGDDLDLSLGDQSLVSHLTATPLEVDGDPASTDDGGGVIVSTDGVTPLPLGGQIGGYLSVLKADLPDYRARLDTLAVALRDGTNAVHQQSTDLDGGTGGEFFTATGASDIDVPADLTEDGVAASRSGSRSDGEGALAMSALRTQTAVGTQTLGAALRAFSAGVGQAVTDATRAATTATSGLNAATLTRTSADGVNVDEEMVDLVKYQQSYSAASRVITMVDDMFDRLINRMGVQ